MVDHDRCRGVNLEVAMLLRSTSGDHENPRVVGGVPHGSRVRFAVATNRGQHRDVGELNEDLLFGRKQHAPVTLLARVGGRDLNPQILRATVLYATGLDMAQMAGRRSPVTLRSSTVVSRRALS